MTVEEKRLLTVTMTLVLLVAMVVLIVVPYVRQWQSYDDIIEHRAQRIQTLKRQVLNKPALMREIELMDKVIQSSKLFIPTADKQVAEAQLLSAVKKMVEKADGQIRSVNILGNRRAARQNTVAIKINFTINNSGLVELLSELASSKPLFNITTTTLIPVVIRQGVRQLDTGNVRLDMVIEGFYSGGGEK